MKRIYLAADHAGVELKNILKEHLRSRGNRHIDMGGHDPHAFDSYPHITDELVHALQLDPSPESRGVVICGTGIGTSIRANRHPGIRAAVVHNVQTARACRQHNNANILCLGARVITPDTAKTLLDRFLATPFEDGRHGPRVAALDMDTVQ